MDGSLHKREPHTPNERQPFDVWLVDDQTLFRQGLALLLGSLQYKVTHEAASIADLLNGSTERTAPAFILFTLRRANNQEVKLVKIARDKFPSSRFVACADPLIERERLLECLEAGVNGVLLLDVSTDVLRGLLGLMGFGERVFPAVFSKSSAGNSLRDSHGVTESRKAVISPRDLQILVLVARGLSNKQIADELGFSEITVKMDLRSLYRKIGATNRTKAATWAMRNGLLGGSIW